MVALFSRRITGLDIGTDTIKVVHIVDGLRGFKITGFAKKKRTGGLSEDVVDLLSNDIRDILDDMPMKSDTFVSALPGNSVAIRNLRLPFSNLNKVRQVIRFEVESILPFLLDDVLVDFSIANMRSVEGTDLVVMAAPKEVLEDHLDIMKSAGIESDIIDLDSSAPFYCFQAMEDGKRDETLSIIDMGAQKTTVTIIRNGILKFVRTIPVGGGAITEKISNELAVDWDAAEELKKRGGKILPCHFNGDDANINADSTDFKVSQAIMSVMDRLRRDVDLSFSFYETLYVDEKITEILLTGGTSRIGNIEQYFQKEFRVNTSLLCPLQSLPNSIGHVEDEDENIIAGALGLALRGGKKVGSWANFRKEEYALEKKFGDVKKGLISVCVGLFVLFSLYVGHVLTQLHLKERTYTNVKIEIRDVFKETFPEVKNIVNEIQQTKNKIQEKKDRMNGLHGGVSLLESLREVSVRIPASKDIRITKLRMNSESVSLVGEANSFDTVDKMHSSLKQSDLFTEIEVRDAKMSTRRGVVTFDLRMSIVQ